MHSLRRMMPPAATPSGSGRPKISIGIGSWTDAEYKGVLYPKGLPDSERLKTYATRFTHVEVNSSYHRIPPVAFTEKWASETPPDFLFDLKLPREIADEPEAAARAGRHVEWLLRSARPLIEAGKLGVFFGVLPAAFSPKKRKLEELDLLIEKLQPHLLAVELRHNGWVEGEQRERTLEHFRARKLVWIAVDMPRVEGSSIMPPIDEVTNPRLAYLRLHGRREDWSKLKKTEERHTYEYAAAELEEIAGRVRALSEKADEVRVVANNHAQDFAPKTALALQRILGLERSATPSPAA